VCLDYILSHKELALASEIFDLELSTDEKGHDWGHRCDTVNPEFRLYSHTPSESDSSNSTSTFDKNCQSRYIYCGEPWKPHLPSREGPALTGGGTLHRLPSHY
jgi:hypothetical protein